MLTGRLSVSLSVLGGWVCEVLGS
ncbi:hypothetical protein LINPERHAP1_LOCUS13737 [Linum perenne]